MKRKLVVNMACAFIMSVGLAGCQSQKEYSEKRAESINTVQIPNPIKEYDTLEDAIKAAGYEFTVPKTIDGYTSKNFETISDNPVLIQVVYGNGDNRLIIRKCAGKDDISGDYNNYSTTKAVTVDDIVVTVKGNDGKVSVATWTNGDYTFAIDAQDVPMTEDDIIKLVKEVK